MRRSPAYGMRMLIFRAKWLENCFFLLAHYELSPGQLERMHRRRPTVSARSKQPSRGTTSLGLLLCLFSFLFWAPGRSSGSEPSETKTANQGSAKSKPVVYETYDPEKALANKPM